MSTAAVLVIDTSVAVKWYIPEPLFTEALQLLWTGDMLVAPDLLAAELGNVLGKKVRRGELTDEEAGEIATAFADQCPVRLVPSRPYLPAALELAIRFERTVYDALYLALAVAQEGRYVTADERLVNALAGTTLRSVIWQLGR